MWNTLLRRKERVYYRENGLGKNKTEFEQIAAKGLQLTALPNQPHANLCGAVLKPC
jgi:hypothetical protein